MEDVKPVAAALPNLERPQTTNNVWAPAATRAGVPGGVIGVLLLVCLFAPYGLIDAGGGTLRPDHLAVPLGFGILLLLGRLSAPPHLASALFGLVFVALVATLFFIDLAVGRPMEAVKNADGLLRGAFVFTMAASIRATVGDLKKVARLLPWIAVVLALLGLADRAFGADSELMDLYVRAYGGPAYTTGVYGELAVNHKMLMMMSNRASAVFVTAPALGMAALVFLELALVAGLGFTKSQRVWLAAAGFVSGLASNSKSFVIGIGVMALLAFFDIERRARTAALGAAAVLLVAGLSIYLGAGDDASRSVNPLVTPESRELGATEVTGGRFGSDESPIVRAMVGVLEDSPLVGFGFGQRPGLNYADSGVNRVLLHSGLVGLLIFVYGLWRQRHWFRNGARPTSPWTRVADHTLVLMVVLLVAGPVFMMPRINDLYFTVMGLGVAMARPARAGDSRASP